MVSFMTDVDNLVRMATLSVGRAVYFLNLKRDRGITCCGQTA